jgi:DNA modification methylase
MAKPWTNKLILGDNLVELSRIPDEVVDLIYLDPPFNSNVDYNVLFKEKSGKKSAAQIKVFKDTWHWSIEAEETFDQTIASGPADLVSLLVAFRSFLRTNDMMAYLVMMAPRLVQLHRILKETGSMYLHCDPTASHYLKLLIDAVFHPTQFRNEIVWRRTGSHNKARRYGPIHDTIFFYTKSDDYKWNNPKKPYMKGHVDENLEQDENGYRTNYYGNVLTGSGIRKGESGQPWMGVDPTLKGRHWAVPGALLEEIDEDLSDLGQHEKLDRLYELGFITFSEGDAWPIYGHYVNPLAGQRAPDIWSFQPYTKGTVFGTEDGVDEDVRWLSPRDQERLDYPTQKPEGILERIIKASSDEGDIVLDPFCGCGTAISVAERLRRRWIGIDITHLAITVIKNRLYKAFAGTLSPYDVIGTPADFRSAEMLALDKDGPYKFQQWAVGLYNGQWNQKKGADRGIDGNAYFQEERGGPAKRIIISVKSGVNVSVKDIRELEAVVAKEKAALGFFISLHKVTEPMNTEAISAGFYETAFGVKYPKIQILTIKDHFEGKVLKYPANQSVTFENAPKAKRGEQSKLF